MPTRNQSLLEDAQMQEAVAASLAEQVQQQNDIVAGQDANLEAQEDINCSDQVEAVTFHEINEDDKAFGGIQQPLKLRLKIRLGNTEKENAMENATNDNAVSGKRKRNWHETAEQTRSWPHQRTPNVAVGLNSSNSKHDECDRNDGSKISSALSDDATMFVDCNECCESTKKEENVNLPQAGANIDVQQTEPTPNPQDSSDLMRSVFESCERDSVKLAKDLVEWCKDNETQKSWLELTAHRILQELLLLKTTTATVKAACSRNDAACSRHDEGQEGENCVDTNFASPYLPNFNAEQGESAFEILNKLMDPGRSDAVKKHRDILFGSEKSDRMVEATAYIQRSCAVFHPLWAKDYKLTDDTILLCIDQKKLAEAYPFSLRLIAEELKLWDLLTVLLDDWDLKATEWFRELFANVKEGGWQSSSKTDLHCLIFVCRTYRVMQALQWTNIQGSLARKVKRCLEILQKNSQNKENIAVSTLRSLQQENVVNRNLAGSGILPNDVLFRQGEVDLTNMGNKKFHSIVAEFQEDFFRAAAKTTEDRNDIVNMIVKRVCKNGGRFLIKKDSASNAWTLAPQKKIFDMTEKILYDAMYKRYGPSRWHNEDERRDNATTPSRTGTASFINCNDVLWGRGLEVKNHVGNMKFRSIFAEYKVKFLQTTEREVELGIVKDIVDRVLQNGGRFLKHDEKNNVWVEVPPDKASDDAAHSLLAAKYKKLRQAT